MSNISKLFSDGITDVIAVSIVLGIMIFVHEWGHFIAAKLLGGLDPAFAADAGQHRELPMAGEIERRFPDAVMFDPDMRKMGARPGSRLIV